MWGHNITTCPDKENSSHVVKKRKKVNKNSFDENPVLLSKIWYLLFTNDFTLVHEGAYLICYQFDSVKIVLLC